VVITVVLINFTLFLTDGLTSEGFPRWWIYPACVSSMILIAIYAWKFEGFSPLTTAFYEYFIANTLFFLIWLEETHLLFPWWIIPMFLLAIPLVIVYMRTIYTEYRVWLYIVVSLILFDIMIFLIWGFVNSGIPWFLIIWGASAGAIAFLFWRNKNEYYDAVQDSAGASAARATTGGTGNAAPVAYDPWSETTQDDDEDPLKS